MAARPRIAQPPAAEPADLEHGLSDAMNAMAQAPVPAGIAEAATALADALAKATDYPLATADADPETTPPDE